MLNTDLENCPETKAMEKDFFQIWKMENEK